jgi:hypothetical protein
MFSNKMFYFGYIYMRYSILISIRKNTDTNLWMFYWPFFTIGRWMGFLWQDTSSLMVSQMFPSVCFSFTRRDSDPNVGIPIILPDWVTETRKIFLIGYTTNIVKVCKTQLDNCN